MITLPPDVREVYLYKKPISMGWGPTRLKKLCIEEMEINPKEGGVFLFFNKSQDQLKIFFCDLEGDQTVDKKLLKGAFLLPTSTDSQAFIKIRAKSLPTLFKS